MTVDQSIKNNTGFALTCEQNIFALPQVEGQVWGPRSLLYLLWPTEQIEGDAAFTYQQGTGLCQVQEMTVAHILERVNTYLKMLQFRVMRDTGEAVLDLHTVEDIEEHQCSFEYMSGGEQSKLRLALYFAMAEVIQPQMFLIDEPYNHIDNQDCVRQAMRAVKQQLPNSVILVVTHQDSSNLHLQAYDKLVLIDKASKNAVRYMGRPDDYADWLQQQGEGLVQKVPEHQVYHLPA